MIKKIVTISAAAAIFAMSANSVFAAQPNNQACLGNDISGYAQDGQTEPADFMFEAGAGWGGFISRVAGSPGADGQFGVAGEIHAHQAGLIPDFVIPNSCNN